MIVPLVVIRPILAVEPSINHKFPSDPCVIAVGPEDAVGIEYSVIEPAFVILPILLAAVSTNHRLPSGPGGMPRGLDPLVGMGYSTIVGCAASLDTLNRLHKQNEAKRTGICMSCHFILQLMRTTPSLLFRVVPGLLYDMPYHESREN